MAEPPQLLAPAPPPRTGLGRGSTRGMVHTVLFGIGQVETQVVQVLEDLLQSQLGQLAAGAPQALPLAGEAVVLDEQGLDVLSQQLIMLHAPMPQDAGGELVVGVAGSAQHHLHHLLTRPGGHERGGGSPGYSLT